MELNIMRSAAFAYLRQHSHLLPAGVDAVAVAEHLADLTEDEQRRRDAGEPVSRLPLLWLALAQAAGLAVDVVNGQIVDGPQVG
ncbi:MAG: hypothetical protein E6Q97_25485 [Desulfurellales bacterium]|nr:MAG: hypothetical protein E6Q97_25485 [Desulfurellales bacterium]